MVQKVERSNPQSVGQRLKISVKPAINGYLLRIKGGLR